jgi:hypothetical protein
MCESSQRAGVETAKPPILWLVHVYKDSLAKEALQPLLCQGFLQAVAAKSHLPQSASTGCGACRWRSFPAHADSAERKAEAPAGRARPAGAAWEVAFGRVIVGLAGDRGRAPGPLQELVRVGCGDTVTGCGVRRAELVCLQDDFVSAEVVDADPMQMGDVVHGCLTRPS